MPKDKRNPMYGRTHSVVARALMSKAKAGVPKTPAHRAAISCATCGIKKSAAHRAAISAATRGIKKSTVTRERIKTAMLQYWRAKHARNKE